MSTISDAIAVLTAHAKAYAEARALVAQRADDLETEKKDLLRRRLPGIRTALANAADKQALLVAAITSNAQLFNSPKTMTLHGIKFGYQKGKGAVEWDCDDAKLIERIEKKYKGQPALLQQLIKTTKEPIVKGLKELDADDIAKLGITIEATGDYIFVRAADKEVDALVKKILKEGAIEEAVAA